MKHINFIFILLISLFFAACDKKDNANPDLPECKLTKETFVNGNEQSTVAYTYDDHERLIKIVSSDGDYMVSIDIIYDENGRIIKLEGSDGGDQFIGECTWDNNVWSTLFKIKEGDEWIETEWKPVVKLDDNNRILEYLDYEKNDTGAFELFAKSVYTWTGDNISSEVFTVYSTTKRTSRSIFKRKNKQYPANYSYTTNYTYDDKNNAFASVGFMNIIWNELPVTKNNIIKEEESGSQNSYTYEYTYEYNDKDFPVKSSSPSDAESYIQFEYDCN